MRLSPFAIASASPSAVSGKYLAVWEKIGNDRKLECRFEDQWAGHWKKYIAKFSGRITVASKATLLAVVVALTIDTRTAKWRIIMHVRTAQPNLRPIIVAAALLGLALTFGSWPAAAQEWTPRQRAACEPDAIRLCQQYISDIGRVRSCMSHYRRYLSPACRTVFDGGAKKKKARRSR